jgi:lipid A 3-O-deacylase
MKPASFPVIALIVILIIFSCVRPAVAGDEEARRSDTLTLYLENDLFGFDNRDRYYTHGTKISWISRDLSSYREIAGLPSWIHPLIEKMPYVNEPGDRRSVSVSLGQNIYTPADKERSDLIVGDRPYAGITYLAFGLHSKSKSQMDTLELDLGIVGRHSYAEDCQRQVHRWVGSVDPQGWSNQLHDEPAINLFFERKWRWLPTRAEGGLGFDGIPHLGVAAGNVYTGINLGGQLRFGWNLPKDYGTYLIRPGSDSSAPLDDADTRFSGPLHRFGIHLFLAVDGQAVARNILLDGNTFRESHSVDKKPFVANLIGGVGVTVHRFKIVYSCVYRTKEFDGQSEEQQFGSIAVSFTF